MTFFEAIYGSQYYELDKNGKDGNKGRLNGNLLLSAFIVLLLFTIILLMVNFVPDFEKSALKTVRNIFGRKNSGSTIGRLIALPLMAIIYFICAATVGSKKNFTVLTQKFMQLPDEVKKKANMKMLLPFLLLLAVFMAMLFMKL